VGVAHLQAGSLERFVDGAGVDTKPLADHGE
jgi:hypothetical protein